MMTPPKARKIALNMKNAMFIKGLIEGLNHSTKGNMYSIK